MKRRPFLNEHRRAMLKWPALILPPVLGIISFLLVWPLLNLLLLNASSLHGAPRESPVPAAALCGGITFVCTGLQLLVEFLFGPRPRGGYDFFYLRRFPRFGRWVKMLALTAMACYFVHIAVTPSSSPNPPPRLGRYITGFGLALWSFFMLIVEFRRSHEPG